MQDPDFKKVKEEKPKEQSESTHSNKLKRGHNGDSDQAGTKNKPSQESGGKEISLVTLK
jgi:hypothetical protein